MTEFDLWQRRINFNPTRLRAIEKVAVEMEVKLNQAIGARRAYLMKELNLYKSVKVSLLTRALICWPMEMAIEKELDQMKKDLYYREHPPKEGGRLPDELIEKANQFPIHELVEFDARGMALCFKHTEKTGSLHLNRAKNTCRCFGSCQQTFRPVDILVIREGKNFREAVQMLCR